MAKLYLVILLVIFTTVVSYPVNEERRNDELKSLLRELLVYLEDDYRLESSKRAESYLDTVDLDPEICNKAAEMEGNKFGFMTIGLSSTLSKWEFLASGGSGGEPTKESTTAAFSEIKEKYLLPDQQLVLLVITIKRHINAIFWLPEPQNGAMIRTAMVMSTVKSFLPMRLRRECDMLQSNVNHVIQWNDAEDINYAKAFE